MSDNGTTKIDDLKAQIAKEQAERKNRVIEKISAILKEEKCRLTVIPQTQWQNTGMGFVPITQFIIDIIPE
jgi:hypothetical protein